MGRAVFPPCCLTWGQTMLEVMKIMATCFKRSHAGTAALSAPDPAAGHYWPTPAPESPGHSGASLGQSFVGSLLLSPGSWCAQGFVCALQESVFPLLHKFWWLYGGVNGDLLQVGLCHTQVCCTQSPCPCAGHCWLVPLQETLKGRSGLISVGSPGHTLFWALWASLVGTGFDSKYSFTPPTVLLGLLLFPWTWGVLFWWDPTFSCRWLFCRKL